jgi:NAD(P)-dependent dehydrogenase (short-subunit alcohol dehydrogenase family)
MTRLDGKIALITGGTSGMGAAAAKLFQEEGATVIVTGSSEQSAATAKKSLPSVRAIRSDAGDPPAAKQLVKAVAREHGRVDVLFVNAGIARVAHYYANPT